MGQLEIRKTELQIFHLREALRECWSLIQDLCRENDRLRGIPPPPSSEDTKMGFVLKGVYKRKEVVHADADEQTVRKLANTHPYNIRWDAAKLAEYARLYGQPEADVLIASVASGKYDAVESYNKDWVIGETFVPADPVPTAATLPLGPDEEIKHTPMGDVRVRKSTGEIIQAPTAGGLDAQQLEALIDRVVMGCLERWGNS